MSGIDSLIKAGGNWTGAYRLIEGSRPPQESDSHAMVTPLIHERFVRIDYDWWYDGKLQEGSLLCGYEVERRAAVAVWIDTWHMSDKFMSCEGTVSKNGALDIRGSYRVPPGPDWGWRTVIDATRDGTFRMIMYNVTPDGVEELAVEATYKKTRTAKHRPSRRG